jgi:hypothetical protein
MLNLTPIFISCAMLVGLASMWIGRSAETWQRSVVRGALGGTGAAAALCLVVTAPIFFFMAPLLMLRAVPAGLLLGLVLGPLGFFLGQRLGRPLWVVGTVIGGIAAAFVFAQTSA